MKFWLKVIITTKTKHTHTNTENYYSQSLLLSLFTHTHSQSPLLTPSLYAVVAAARELLCNFLSLFLSLSLYFQFFLTSQTITTTTERHTYIDNNELMISGTKALFKILRAAFFRDSTMMTPLFPSLIMHTYTLSLSPTCHTSIKLQLCLH